MAAAESDDFELGTCFTAVPRQQRNMHGSAKSSPASISRFLFPGMHRCASIHRERLGWSFVFAGLLPTEPFVNGIRHDGGYDLEGPRPAVVGSMQRVLEGKLNDPRTHFDQIREALR